MSPLQHVFTDPGHSDYQLPVSFLQASQASINAFHRGGIFKVGEAYTGWLSKKLIGSAATQAGQLFQLLESHYDEASHSFDWVSYGAAVGINKLIITSPQLRRLHWQDRAQSVEALHPQKALKPLEDNGLHTIGELIDFIASAKDITELKGMGKLKVLHLTPAIIALNDSINTSGYINWAKFAQASGMKLIPESLDDYSFDLESLIEEALVEEAAIAEKLAVEKSDDADDAKGTKRFDIFRERVMRPLKERFTLQEIGDVYDVSRERIRQEEALVLGIFQDAFTAGHYSRANFRFRPIIEAKICTVASALESERIKVWPLERWLQVIARTLQLPNETIEEQQHLYMNILGYDVLQNPSKFQTPVVHSTDQISTTERNAILSEAGCLRKIVKQNRAPLAIDETFTRFLELSPDATLEHFHNILSICPTLHRTEDGKLDSNVNEMSVTHRAVHFLSQSTDRKPLHYSEIFENIIEDPDKRPKVASAFQYSDELVPIGRTGKWALREWDLETGTVADVAEEILRNAPGGMATNELADKVLERREFARNTMYTVLCHRPTFTIQGGLWHLTEALATI